MNVLIVDDQLPVVEGLLSGVAWGEIGIQQVFKAYSAFEARGILQTEQVDILLCDIEMPVEDGLSLYRWVKEQGYALECIFLTAHADFAYAKEAVHLGGFDYILQPVRYEEIRSVLLRVQNKISAHREAQIYSKKGKEFTKNQDLYVDGIWQELFSGGNDSTALCAGLEMLGIRLRQEQTLLCGLLQFLKEKDSWTLWQEDILRYAIKNILEELTAPCGCRVLLARKGDGDYGLLFCKETPGSIQVSLVEGRLKLFQQVLLEQLGFSTACYLGRQVPLAQLSQQAALLQSRKADNVANGKGLFLLQETAQSADENVQLDLLLRKWSAMLTGQNAMPVREELHAYLDEQLRENRLNARSLKHFYQRLTQMLTLVGQQRSIYLQKELVQSGLLDEYLTAYQSVEHMRKLIDSLIPYFQTTAPQESGGQIDRVLEYIYDHLEDDIRRADLAREVFLNPDYLARIFKKEMGVPLKEFITTEKMKAAKNLLKNTALPIGTIAVRVGYSNFSHFSQTYRRHMGLSPEEERK